MINVNTLPVIWLALILASIFCEALTERLLAVWGAPAAALSLILWLFKVEAYIQIAAFFISAAVMTLASLVIRSITARLKKHNIEKQGIE